MKRAGFALVVLVMAIAHPLPAQQATTVEVIRLDLQIQNNQTIVGKPVIITRVGEEVKIPGKDGALSVLSTRRTGEHAIELAWKYPDADAAPEMAMKLTDHETRSVAMTLGNQRYIFDATVGDAPR